MIFDNKKEMIQLLIDGKMFESEEENLIIWFDEDFEQPIRCFNTISQSIENIWDYYQIELEWKEIIPWFLKINNPVACFVNSLQDIKLITKYDEKLSKYLDITGVYWEKVTPISADYVYQG